MADVPKLKVLTQSQVEFLEATRWGSLATVDPRGRPHCVPVVFAWDGSSLILPLDRKRKRVPIDRLQRVRNLMIHPNATFMAHRWSENWSDLEWLMVRGVARVDEAETGAVERLRERYPQYRQVGIEALIRLDPRTVTSWRGG